MSQLNMTEYEEFWARCRRRMGDSLVGDTFTVRRMGNSPALCETLLGLVASGEKSGLFSRLAELEAAGLNPSSGDYTIFMDFDGRPRCLVQMGEGRRLKFSEVGPEQTACESPAARDVEVWRDIHRRYWTPVMAAEGAKFSEDTPVFFQKFKLLYAEPAAVQGS